MAQAITLARPYARAAFELAQVNHALPEWSVALAFAAAVASDRQVVALSHDPRVQPIPLAELHLPQGSAIDSPFGRFIAELAQLHRTALLPEIAALYESYKRDAESQLLVKVTSAMTLDAAQIEQLKASLKRRFKREIVLDAHIDSSLLGGLIIDTGSDVIDGSARGRLERLAAALA